MATIGTCSLCGGPVMLPDVWFGVHPPTPKCLFCGAVPSQPYGPMIPMRPKQPKRLEGWTYNGPVPKNRMNQTDRYRVALESWVVEHGSD